MKPSDDPSNLPANPASQPTNLSRSILVVAALWVLVGIALTAYFRWKPPRKPLPDDPQEALQVAIDETDRLDPGWRLRELEEKRAAIPDDENAALRVLAAHARLPKRWPTWRALDRLAGRELARFAGDRYAMDIRKVPTRTQFNKQQLFVLKEELRQADAALTEARKLADLSQGRLPPGPPSKAAFLGSNPHLEQVRKIMELLEMDAKVRAQDGELDDALASCRALLNAGRAIGDEPDSIAQLVRLAFQSMAVSSLERTLAQGAPSPTALASTQHLLEEEAQVPTLLTAARGERASIDFFLGKIHDGAMTIKEIESLENIAASLHGGERKSAAVEDKGASSNFFVGRICNPSSFRTDCKSVLRSYSWTTPKWYAPERINWYRAWCLRYTSDFVEISKRPEPWPIDDLRKLEATLKGQPALLRTCLGGKEKLVDSCGRNRARLRCAVVALAVERYRKTNGRWPASLSKLVPEQIARIPTDPYDGRRLRYCRVGHGFGVYSIGPDGKDDNCDVRDPMERQRDADVGFRLWNPQLRRQSPLPEQPLDELPGKDDE